MVCEQCHNSKFFNPVGTHEGLIDSTQEVTEEVRGVEECSGGMVHKLCLCGCAHTCVTAVTLC